MSAPRVETIQDGSYVPLSRPQLLYLSDAALKKPAVKALVDYYLENVDGVAESAGFVPLTDEQAEKAEATAKKGARRPPPFFTSFLHLRHSRLTSCCHVAEKVAASAGPSAGDRVNN
jgi:hypothetical protein